MKKYIFMTLTVALLGLAACTEDAFDRITRTMNILHRKPSRQHSN